MSSKQDAALKNAFKGSPFLSNAEITEIKMVDAAGRINTKPLQDSGLKFKKGPSEIIVYGDINRLKNTDFLDQKAKVFFDRQRFSLVYFKFPLVKAGVIYPTSKPMKREKILYRAGN